MVACYINRSMGGQAQTDPALQAVIDETAPKFQQFTYTDGEEEKRNGSVL